MQWETTEQGRALWEATNWAGLKEVRDWRKQDQGKRKYLCKDYNAGACRVAGQRECEELGDKERLRSVLSTWKPNHRGLWKDFGLNFEQNWEAGKLIWSIGMTWSDLHFLKNHSAFLVENILCINQGWSGETNQVPTPTVQAKDDAGSNKNSSVSDGETCCILL